MNNKVLVALLLATLFATTFAAVMVKPAHAIAYGVHFLNPFPFNSLYNIINFGPAFVPGDHIHILAGHYETLPSALFIDFPGLWIFGAPNGSIPSIDLGGQMVIISALNVFIYGLDFWDSTGTSSSCMLLAPQASNCTIRACSLRGSLVPNSRGVWINSSSNLIACNVIRGWGIGIYVMGPSSGNLIKLNNIDYSMMPNNTAYGVQVGGGAGIISPNRVCWNNISAPPATPGPGMGQELWDFSPGNPLNLFDDTGLLPHSFGKGNYESSWGMHVPYPVAGPGMNGWLDSFPLIAPMSPIQGDINLDGVVDIFDAILLSNAFGKPWCDPKWDSRADLKPDGVIDIYDAITLANNFNKHY